MKNIRMRAIDRQEECRTERGDARAVPKIATNDPPIRSKE